jgi:hypothetical protein
LDQEFVVRITVDFDSDGVDNFTEAFAGDRNKDGINDAQQNAVASLPVLNSDPGDPETYLSITATGQDNPYVAALDKTASDGGQLSATVKISSVEVGAVSADDRQAVKAVLGGSEVDDLRTDLGLLGFSLEPTVEVTMRPLRITSSARSTRSTISVSLRVNRPLLGRSRASPTCLD